jgi:hypothetical protein
MLEPALSVLAIGVILYLGRLGILFGAFQELSNALWLFFAMMVTLRYWWLVTGVLISFTPLTGAYAALVAFWALFLVACVSLLLLIWSADKGTVARYPRILDSVFGATFGALSAAILVSCLMLSLSVILPEIVDSYQRTGLIVPLDKLPIGVYQTMEKDCFGIPEDDPGHTRLPTLEKANADDFKKYWK